MGRKGPRERDFEPWNERDTYTKKKRRGWKGYSGDPTLKLNIGELSVSYKEKNKK